MKNNVFYGIDWLRSIACIGIVLMHIKANSTYEISGFIYEQLIPSFTDFVYLFMSISAFVLCYKYYDKVLSGDINWVLFYKKRYQRILPFFALLILLDIVRSLNVQSLLEGLTELTLLHGFIPQDLSVIGVGWFLGTVFIFYLIFPFFCVIIKNKRNAWIAFAISILLHYIAQYYFELNRHNIVFSLCYFLAGGIIFLYKDKLVKIKWWVYMLFLAMALFCYYKTNSYGTARMLIVSIMLSFAISIENGYNKVIVFISGISLEIYLSHMFVFRIIERLHLNVVLGNGWIQYIFTSILVICGTACFAYIAQQLLLRIERKVAGLLR